MGLSVAKAASALGVSDAALLNIVNGKASISAEMAVRLSMAFNTSAESWLGQQMQHDLWLAEQQRASLTVTPLHP